MYRITGNTGYWKIPMVESKPGEFSAVISGKDITLKGLQYFIEAVDKAGNSTKTTNENKPHQIKVLFDDLYPPVITHIPITQYQKGKPLKIYAIVKDSVEVSSVKLYYRKVNAKEYRQVYMQCATIDTYFYDVPISDVSDEGIEYYITASDSKPNISSSGSPSNPHKINVIVLDKESPNITHKPINKMKKGDSITVKAIVTDNKEVKEVDLFYRFASTGDYTLTKMTKDIGDEYSTILSTSIDTSATSIQYYISASDLSGNQASFKSADSPVKVSIEHPKVKKPKPEKQEPQVAKKGKPFYTKWWFWSGTALVGGGTAVAIVLTQSKEEKTTKEPLPTPPGPPTN